MIGLHRLAFPMGMKITETKRLLLEKANLKDDEFFLQLLNSPNWLKFIGDRSVKSSRDARAYIENSLIKSYQENGFGLYKTVIKEESKPIGICGFLQREYLELPDIGFAILPAYEGQGLITEAAFAMMDYGKNRLGLKEIFGLTTNENIGSQRILNKIGLMLKGDIYPPNETEALLLFSNKND